MVMTRVFTVDENNDLVIASDGLLSISSGLEAVLQACEQAAKAQLAEMVLAVEQGVPTFQTVWNGAPNVSQFEAYLRRQLQNVTGVREVSAVEVTVANNVLSYTATILTQFGQGVLNG
jgi:hypothetical protein